MLCFPIAVLPYNKVVVGRKRRVEADYRTRADAGGSTWMSTSSVSWRRSKEPIQYPNRATVGTIAR